MNTIGQSGSGLFSNGWGPIKLTRPELQLEISGTELISKFSGEDSGAEVTATFVPEQNITTVELMKVMQLQYTIAMYALSGSIVNLNPIEYIRQHNLERHFKFAAV